jgi:hypothetical protein
VNAFEEFDFFQRPALLAVGAGFVFAMFGAVGFAAGDAPVFAVGVLHAGLMCDVFAALTADFGDDGFVGGMGAGVFAAGTEFGQGRDFCHRVDQSAAVFAEYLSGHGFSLSKERVAIDVPKTQLQK